MSITRSAAALLLGATMFTALSTGTASAAGTAANTSVSNTFTLDYRVGGVDQPTIDTGPGGTNTPTLFTVDRVVNLTVSSAGDTTVAPGETDAELVFSVVNTGNDTQSYALTLFNETEPSGPTDPDGFNSTVTFRTFRDDGTTPGVFDAGDTEIVYTAGHTADIAPDERFFVVVEGDIPVTATNGDIADISLVADTLYKSGATAGVDGGVEFTAVQEDTGGNNIVGVPENVLADGENDVDYDHEDANEGDHSATATYIVSSADVVANKEVGVVNEGGGCPAIPATLPGTIPNAGNAVPGSCVEYRITVQNTGGAAATDIVVADQLPTSLTFVETAGRGFTTAVNPTTSGTCPAGPCTVNLSGAAVAPAQTGTLVIRALIK